MSNAPAPERLAFSPDEAAAALGLGRTTIYQLLTAGAIRSVKVGKRRLIPRNALDEFLDESGAA